MNNLNALVVAECKRLIKEETVKSWFSSQVNKITSGGKFFISFGMAPRKTGKEAIKLSEELQNEMKSINPVVEQTQWTLDELVRLAFLLTLPLADREAILKKLIATSDIRELRLIYKSIQYLSQPEDFELDVIDGIRTNMIDVFDAIALHNSYPARHFKEEPWNQMVLKAIFMERPIYCIHGLDERRNANLARIAIDFAHERQSAGRKVTPELWRLVAPYIDEQILQDLIFVIRNGDNLEKEAGIRAIKESGFPSALTWLKTEGITSEARSWDTIGEVTFSSK